MRPQISPEHTACDAPGGTYAVPRAGLQSGDVDQRDASLKDRHRLSGQNVYMHAHSPRHMHKRPNSSHVSSRLTWLDPQRAPCEARCLYCTFIIQITRHCWDFSCRPSVAASLRVTREGSRPLPCMHAAIRRRGRGNAWTLPAQPLNVRSTIRTGRRTRAAVQRRDVRGFRWKPSRRHAHAEARTRIHRQFSMGLRLSPMSDRERSVGPSRESS